MAWYIHSMEFGDYNSMNVYKPLYLFAPSSTVEPDEPSAVY